MENQEIVAKEKKPRTEKQLKAFEKARNVLLEKRKGKIEQELNANKIPNKIPEPPKIEPPKKIKIEKEPEPESEEEKEPVQQIIYKKKPKPKIVYVSDSEEEEEPAPIKKVVKKTVSQTPLPTPIKKVNPYTSMLNNSSRF